VEWKSYLNSQKKNASTERVKIKTPCHKQRQYTSFKKKKPKTKTNNNK